MSTTPSSTSSSTSTSSSSSSSSMSSSDTLALATSTATQLSSAADSTSDFFTTTDPTTTATSTVDSNANDPTNLATSTSLYLFTFLATLLLLLAISCTIVVRSFIIRRRFNRRVQEALAEGIILAPPPGALGGRRRFDPGEKPKLWDAHLGPPLDSKESKWDALMPVSVKVLSNKLTGAGQQLSTPPARPRSRFFQAPSFGFAGSNRPRWLPRFIRPRSHPPEDTANNNANNGSADASHPSSPGEPETIIEDARLQVGVLIAMPSPYRPRAWRSVAEDPRGRTRDHLGGEGEDSDEELPDMVLGTTELPWKVAVPASAPAEQTGSNTPASLEGGREPEGAAGQP